MSKVKIFHDYNGQLFAFIEDTEEQIVTKVMEARHEDLKRSTDHAGSVTYTRTDKPECWCRTYPSDHPDIPRPDDFDQQRKVLPGKPRP